MANNTKKERPLSIKEKAFCRYYVQLANGTQAVKKAGYVCKNDGVAGAKANMLLKKGKIRQEITKIEEKIAKPTIMDAQEVMEHFTAIARGEEKDQFGLDISASDRIRALQEIAKRTVDVENRKSGTPDQLVSIQLDWGEEE